MTLPRVDSAAVLPVTAGVRFLRVRQFAERHVEDLCPALVDHDQLHGLAGGHAADGAGEFARILHRLIVDPRDHVTGFNACLGGGTIDLRLPATSAPSGFFAEAVGDLSVTCWIWTPIQPRLTEPLS